MSAPAIRAPLDLEPHAPACASEVEHYGRHYPPCPDAAVHARLVLAEAFPAGDAAEHAERAARLIVLSRNAELGIRLPMLECE